MKQSIKRVTPSPVWKLGSDLYWGWKNRARHVLAQAYDPRWRASQKRLEAYRDLHQGRRCFVIGNGPSLRQTDMSRLRDEITFGLNRIYLAFDELGFTTSYLIAVNDLVLEQCASDMTRLPLPKFVTWRARRWFKGSGAVGQETVFLDTDFTGEENFSAEATGRIFEGFTVTYVALQLAYFMGCQQVYLVGVDHNYATQGPANLAVVSQGEDPNHFSPHYFGKGFKWQLPDLDGNERAYHLARNAYEAAGRSIINATVGGKLEVFPRVAYNSLFGD